MVCCPQEVAVCMIFRLFLYNYGGYLWHVLAKSVFRWWNRSGLSMNVVKAAANYGHLKVPRLKQDAVPIDIVPDLIPEQYTALQMQNRTLTIHIRLKFL